jgi:hypothetical protein
MLARQRGSRGRVRHGPFQRRSSAARDDARDEGGLVPVSGRKVMRFHWKAAGLTADASRAGPGGVPLARGCDHGRRTRGHLRGGWRGLLA